MVDVETEMSVTVTTGEEVSAGGASAREISGEPLLKRAASKAIGLKWEDRGSSFGRSRGWVSEGPRSALESTGAFE